MFCDRCQIEIEPILDQWDQPRCPTCKQSLTALSNLSDDSGDKGSSDKKKKSGSVSPIYDEYLKTTAKFRDRKKTIFSRFKSLFT